MLSFPCTSCPPCRSPSADPPQPRLPAPPPMSQAPPSLPPAVMCLVPRWAPHRPGPTLGPPRPGPAPPPPHGPPQPAHPGEPKPHTCATACAVHTLWCHSFMHRHSFSPFTSHVAPSLTPPSPRPPPGGARLFGAPFLPFPQPLLGPPALSLTWTLPPDAMCP